MNCKYHRVRTKKGVKYGYCSLYNKVEDLFKCNCSDIEYKEYKQLSSNKTLLKSSKIKSSKPSKRTVALSITKDVKMKVWERDNHKCIFCHKEVAWNFANSHFIKRSQSGLGIEENIMTNCVKCHTMFDDSIHRKEMIPIAERYFKSKYSNWNKDKLVYKK